MPDWTGSQLNVGVGQADTPLTDFTVAHYTKLGVLALRSFGLIILLYAVPIVAWGALRLTIGELSAAERAVGVSSLFGWFIYAVAGVLLLKFAHPLARIAARGLDEITVESPSA